MNSHDFVPDEIKSDTTLRPPEPGDVDRMTRFFESLSETSRKFYHPHPFDVEHARSICCDATPEWYRLVAQHGDRIVGYACFGPSEKYAYPVVGIGISDDFQGMGLGGALMDALALEAKRRGHCELALTVYKTNERGMMLYASRGYRTTGEEGRQHVMELVF